MKKKDEASNIVGWIVLLYILFMLGSALSHFQY